MGDMCRICMTAKKELVRLINESTNKLERSGEKFEDCFGIKINEIPYCQKICRNCELQLIDFFYFKQQAVRSHNYLLDKGPDIQVEVLKIKEEEPDPEISGDDDDNSSNVEFFNLEYLDEEAVHVEMLNFPLPKIEGQSSVGSAEIKEELIEDENSMENPVSENFDDDTGLENESHLDLLADLGLESQDESVAISGNNEDEKEESYDSDKDQIGEKPAKRKIKFFKRSIGSVYRHRCNQCNHNFKSDKKYKDHLKIHMEEDGLNTAERSHDKSRRSRPNVLRVDGKIKYFKNSQHFKYNCEECGKNFLYEFSYQAHKNVHKGLPPFNCEICGKGFKQKVNYIYHMKNHYGERNFKCDLCGKAFLVQWDLDLHMRSHTDARPFMCDICGKGFRISNHLTNHRETHNETNIYECHLCPTKLHTRVTLKRHLASCHKIGNLKQCPFCQRQFARLDRFKFHIQKFHGVLLTLASDTLPKDDNFIDVVNT